MKIFRDTAVCALLALLASSFGSTAEADSNFDLTNLVSDQVGIAPNTDPNLVNSWGLTFDSHGNLIVADNGTSLATSYAKDGTIRSFVINVPSDPSGVIKNHSDDAFIVSGFPVTYLFATEDGTILAFNKNLDPNNAFVVIDMSSQNAVYKGLAIAKSNGESFLYAADFYNGLVDVFDESFNFLFSFTETPTPPVGYAPFNILEYAGNLYVSYAKQAPGNHDDQAGPGNGFVDIFNLDGTFVQRLISNGALNSPWGLAIAPKHFGKFGGKLLVGNFGNGVINVYDTVSGAFQGQLSNENGVIIIPGLWAIRFDKRHSDSSDSSDSHHSRPVLFFTSGPNGEADGLVGKITPHEGFSSSSSSSSW